jgi:hypothetical protein
MLGFAGCILEAESAEFFIILYEKELMIHFIKVCEYKLASNSTAAYLDVKTLFQI